MAGRGNPARLTCLDTLRAVTREGLSVTRFGDGECPMAFTTKSIEFQQWSPELRDGLLRTLSDPKPQLLTTFNHLYHDHLFVSWIAQSERHPKRYAFRRSLQDKADVGILWCPRDMLMCRRYWSLIRARRHHDRWGDTSMFYPGCYLEDYAQGRMDEVKDEFRKPFAGRRTLFVAPETPMGGTSFREEGAGLRAIALRDADFLAIPAINAFEHYDEILAEIRRRPGFDNVFIQAGPAATAAASDLSGTIETRVIDAGSLNTPLRYLA